jgi:pimeloyl-ACP methyl ester carboxylesterase
MTELIRIEQEGLTLAAREAGDPSRSCLVLLHGWPQTSLAWEGVLPELGHDAYALAFDLPGVGDSRGTPPSAEKKVLADLILSAAEKAGGTSIIICGYDVGGMIAFAAARDYGSRIEGAIVMNTVIPGLDPWEKSIADPRIWHFALHNVPDLPELLVRGHERAYFDFFYDVMAGDAAALPDDRRDAYTHGYARTAEALKAGFEWYRAMANDAKHNARAKRIDTPILYLRGDADGRSPHDYIPGLKQAGAKHVEGGVLPNSGEYAPEEAPDALIAALRRFRKNCDALRAAA